MILLTGINGQLGSDVAKELQKNKIEFLAPTRSEADITKKEDIEKLFFENDITAVIHCAAYTAVDKAEDEKEICFAVNVTGTKNLAECAEKARAKFLYISTDYVFSGESEAPFEVTDEKNPKNYYGKTKLLGEEEVKRLLKKYFIIRTSWVFGEKNTNFVYTMLRLSKTRNEINVVSDQIGSPTYSKDLAQFISEIIKGEKYGEYHFRNDGCCSWAEFARKIFEIKNLPTRVIPIKSEEYPTKALRSKNSRLSLSSLSKNGFEKPRSWENALREYLSNINKN